jgi:hypothetical protein
MLKANENLMTVAVIAAIATTLLISATSADAEGKGHRGNAEHKTTQQFNRLDTNEDEILALSELLTPALIKTENKFNSADTDEDGFLTFEEATAGLYGNNGLSDIAEEIVQCVADTVAETANELINELTVDNFQSPQDKFDNKDTSLDSLLDLTEMLDAKTAQVTSTFANMDNDGSDTVSFDEYLLYKQQRQATRRAVKSCVDELTDDEEV